MPNVTRMRPEVVQRAAYEPAQLDVRLSLGLTRPWLVGRPVGGFERLCRVGFGQERLHVRSLWLFSEPERSCPLGALCSTRWLEIASGKGQIVLFSCGFEPQKTFTREARVARVGSLIAPGRGFTTRSPASHPFAVRRLIRELTVVTGQCRHGNRTSFRPWSDVACCALPSCKALIFRAHRQHYSLCELQP